MTLQGLESSQYPTPRMQTLANNMAVTLRCELGLLASRLDLYQKGLVSKETSKEILSCYTCLLSCHVIHQDILPSTNPPDLLATVYCLQTLQRLIEEVVDCKVVVQDSHSSLSPLLADFLLLLSHHVDLPSIRDETWTGEQKLSL